MDGKKVCIDIGGTKMLFALIDSKQKILRWKEIYTPKTKAAFKAAMRDNVREFAGESDVVNISIPGRTDDKSRIVFAPNAPMAGLNLKKELSRWFKHVNVENDANCFAIYEIFKGPLKKAKAGLILVWGTGVGGSIVINGRVYKGAGLASELGHIRLFDRESGDLESLIGGNSVMKRYYSSGLELHSLALKGNDRARHDFDRIGSIFGRYLSSLMYVLDPEVIILGGSFMKSWNFMKKTVKKEIRKSTIRKKVKIKVVNDKFYVIRGCYFLDEYEKIHNKL